MLHRVLRGGRALSSGVGDPASTLALLETAELAARAGAAVVRDALEDRFGDAALTGADHRAGADLGVVFKGASDLVTATDKASEAAILRAIGARHPSHVCLAEESGVVAPLVGGGAAAVGGGAAAAAAAVAAVAGPDDTLWCIDPLDGTTNFVHGYSPFAVSVAAMRRVPPPPPPPQGGGSSHPPQSGPPPQWQWQWQPQAACVVEFVCGAGGSSLGWPTRVFTAAAGHGAFCQGRRIGCTRTDALGASLLATGFGYDHGAAWEANMGVFRSATDASRGVRRAGAAAVDLCHVGLGVLDGFWELELKPWDQAAGMLIVTEAGGEVRTMEGELCTPFSRTVLACNSSAALRGELLALTAPAIGALKGGGYDLADTPAPQ
jgi:myo-inositol-1(or 4)-monophosphatase